MKDLINWRYKFQLCILLQLMHNVTTFKANGTNIISDTSQHSTIEIPKPILPSKLLAAYDPVYIRSRNLKSRNWNAEKSKKPSMVDIALEIAAREGIDAMTDLYQNIEPRIVRNGQILEDNHPAALLSKFSAPLEGSERSAMAAFATLSATKAFRRNNKESDVLGRQAQSQKVSFRRTPLEGLCPPREPPTCMPASQRYRTHDGTCNNRRRLRWGSAQMPFNRFLPPEYGDGVDSIRGSVEGGPLSSSRFVSLLVHGAREGESSLTLMIVQWGQLLDHDLTSTAQPRSINGSVPSCCGSKDFHPSCFPIKVPLDDPWLAPLKVRCLEFLRSAPAQRRDCVLSWREQTNQVTSYIDASPIYSSNAKTSDNARIFRNGLLMYGRGDPKEDVCMRGALAHQCIRSGDGRSGEQPGLLALHHVWVGEHNRIAMELSILNPHWSDEKVYQETRRIVGALFQHITYREFLPIVLGREVCKLFDLDLVKTGYYTGYDPNTNPTVSNAFAAAAFRFGHSLVQNSYMRCDRHHNFINNNVTLHEEFQQGDIGTAGSLHRLLRGLATQKALKRDEFITPELTNHLFQTPGFPFGLDLAAINIQRGRDHGIAPYTAWRQPCGLSAITTWDDLSNVVGPESAHRISHAYRNVHDIDLFVGGIAERPVVGGLVGPTFACIIAQQFSNSRKGDRFWYENSGFESSFTPAQLNSLRHVSLSSVLCRALNGGTLQPHVFIPSDVTGNQRVKCGKDSLEPIDLKPWLEQDPFLSNNEQIAKPISQNPTMPSPMVVQNNKEEKGINNRLHNLTMVANVDFIPNSSIGFHRVPNMTKIHDKLDMAQKIATRPFVKPVRGVSNKLDKNRLGLKNPHKSTVSPLAKRTSTTTRRTVVIHNIEIELRNAGGVKDQTKKAQANKSQVQHDSIASTAQNTIMKVAGVVRSQMNAALGFLNGNNDASISHSSRQLNDNDVTNNIQAESLTDKQTNTIDIASSTTGPLRNLTDHRLKDPNLMTEPQEIITESTITQPTVKNVTLNSNREQTNNFKTNSVNIPTLTARLHIDMSDSKTIRKKEPQEIITQSTIQSINDLDRQPLVKLLALNLDKKQTNKNTTYSFSHPVLITRPDIDETCNNTIKMTEPQEIMTDPTHLTQTPIQNLTINFNAKQTNNYEINSVDLPTLTSTLDTDKTGTNAIKMTEPQEIMTDTTTQTESELQRQPLVTNMALNLSKKQTDNDKTSSVDLSTLTQTLHIDDTGSNTINTTGSQELMTDSITQTESDLNRQPHVENFTLSLNTNSVDLSTPAPTLDIDKTGTKRIKLTEPQEITTDSINQAENDLGPQHFVQNLTLNIYNKQTHNLKTNSVGLSTLTTRPDTDKIGSNTIKLTEPQEIMTDSTIPTISDLGRQPLSQNTTNLDTKANPTTSTKNNVTYESEMTKPDTFTDSYDTYKDFQAIIDSALQDSLDQHKRVHRKTDFQVNKVEIRTNLDFNDKLRTLKIEKSNKTIGRQLIKPIRVFDFATEIIANQEVDINNSTKFDSNLTLHTTTELPGTLRNVELRQFQERPIYNRPQKLVLDAPPTDQYEIEINIRQTNTKPPNFYANNVDYNSPNKRFDSDRYTSNNQHYDYQQPQSTSSDNYFTQTTRVPFATRTKPPTIIYINEHDERPTTKAPGFFQNIISFASNGLSGIKQQAASTNGPFNSNRVTNTGSDNNSNNFLSSQHSRPYQNSKPSSGNYQQAPPFPQPQAFPQQGFPQGSPSFNPNGGHPPGALPVPFYPPQPLPGANSFSSASNFGGTSHASSSAVSTGHFGAIVGNAAVTGGDSTFSFNIRPSSRPHLNLVSPTGIKPDYELLPQRRPAHSSTPSYAVPPKPISSVEGLHYPPNKQDPFSTQTRRPQTYYNKIPSNSFDSAYDDIGRSDLKIDESIEIDSNQNRTNDNTDFGSDDYDYNDDDDSTFGNIFKTDNFLHRQESVENDKIDYLKLAEQAMTNRTKLNTTVFDDNFVMPALRSSDQFEERSVKDLNETVYTAIEQKSFNHDILAEDYDELLSGRSSFLDSQVAAASHWEKSKGPLVNVPVAFAPIKILTKPERPDNWVIFDTPDKKPVLPDQPDYLFETSVAAEFPMPLQKPKISHNAKLKTFLSTPKNKEKYSSTSEAVTTQLEESTLPVQSITNEHYSTDETLRTKLDETTLTIEELTEHTKTMRTPDSTKQLDVTQDTSIMSTEVETSRTEQTLTDNTQTENNFINTATGTDVLTNTPNLT